jgi:tetratricopeptide (TPR) repeat protein
MRRLPLFAFFILCAALHAQDASTLIDQGVAAFKAAHYEEAAEFFRRVIAAAPEQTRAHLYLATTYAAQVIPNLRSPDNLDLAAKALEQFDLLLQADPENLNALAQKGALLRNTDRPEEAIAVERTIERLDPKDAIAPYTIGVLDWLKAYKNAVDLLGQEGLKDQGDGNPLKSLSLCLTLAAQNSVVLDDASAELTRAIQLKPDYEDAMTYLSLVYCRRADLHCDPDPAANQQGIAADLKQADYWAQESMAARRRVEIKKVDPASASPQPSHQPK